MIGVITQGYGSTSVVVRGYGGAGVVPPPPPPPPPPIPSVSAGGGGGGPSIEERVLKDMKEEIDRMKRPRRRRRLKFVEALIVYDFDVAAALAESAPDAP